LIALFPKQQRQSLLFLVAQVTTRKQWLLTKGLLNLGHELIKVQWFHHSSSRRGEAVR